MVMMAIPSSRTSINDSASTSRYRHSRQTWVNIAFVIGLMLIGTTTLQFLRDSGVGTTITTGVDVGVGRPVTTVHATAITTGINIKDNSKNKNNKISDNEDVFLKWKTVLGCQNDTSVDVCQAKIDVLLEKETSDAAYWNKRVAQARTRSQTGFDDYREIALITDHPALTPLLPKYQPDPTWRSDRSFPDLNVVGLAKTGTSQLYKILTQHADTVAFSSTSKEYCMYGSQQVAWEGSGSASEQVKWKVQANLFDWHSQLAAKAAAEREQRNNSTAAKTKTTVNGCLNLHDLWLHLHYAPSTTSKYLVLLRDPADWLWAAYNFWVDPHLDARQDEHTAKKLWASPAREYRSPELFHELVVSAHQTKSGGRLLDTYRRQTVTTGRRLTALAGRANVLFLRNEDMLPEHVDAPLGFLHQLSNFTGLDRGSFSPAGLHTMMNCNDQKGFTTECGDGSSNASSHRGSYEIAGGRKMLENTRAFIYLHYQEECQIWAAEFGVSYPDCVNALPPVDNDGV